MRSRDLKVAVIAVAAVLTASLWLGQPPAQATAPGLQTVALIASDPQGVSVWHAEGGRLRRCQLDGTQEYRCGPWR